MCVKKTKFGAKIKAFEKTNFLFFYIDNKQYRLFAKLDERTYIMEMYM
jgi:hypothetical protein